MTLPVGPRHTGVLHKHHDRLAGAAAAMGGVQRRATHPVFLQPAGQHTRAANHLLLVSLLGASTRRLCCSSGARRRWSGAATAAGPQRALLLIMSPLHTPAPPLPPGPAPQDVPAAEPGRPGRHRYGLVHPRVRPPVVHWWSAFLTGTHMRVWHRYMAPIHGYHPPAHGVRGSCSSVPRLNGPCTPARLKPWPLRAAAVRVLRACMIGMPSFSPLCYARTDHWCKVEGSV